MTRNPALHQAPLGYGKSGPLTWVAECRIPWEAPGATRLEMARWMITNGSDVHQGGDGPLGRAALNDLRIEMMALLVEHGADVNARWNGFYPIVCSPCEALAPETLRWLLAHGADPRAAAEPNGNDALAMVIGTCGRAAARKHACIEALVDAGVPIPDTPTMALHRGRIDLLGIHLARDPHLLERRFTETEIYPAEIGLKPDQAVTLTSIAGTTLLHLAIEYDDLATATWLVEQGAAPNASAEIDEDGFGGHTPLFHSIVNFVCHTEPTARLLLTAGANPNARAAIRKQLRDMGDPEKELPREFHGVTPIGYAGQFVEQAWVSDVTIAVVREFGGVE